jgi:hypothetical protein
MQRPRRQRTEHTSLATQRNQSLNLYINTGIWEMAGILELAALAPDINTIPWHIR